VIFQFFTPFHAQVEKSCHVVLKFAKIREIYRRFTVIRRNSLSGRGWQWAVYNSKWNVGDGEVWRKVRLSLRVERCEWTSQSSVYGTESESYENSTLKWKNLATPVGIILEKH